MPAAVVYDPDGVLPSSFVADIGLGPSVVLVEVAADAHRLARDANVLVLVAGRDNSAVLGFLALSSGRRWLRLVLLASDARHHRRVLIRAMRHQVRVLIGEAPDALADCIRDLLMNRPISSGMERDDLATLGG